VVHDFGRGSRRFSYIATALFEPPENSKNHDITKAEDFDDDVTQLVKATVVSAPVKNKYDHLKMRPDDQDHVKLAKDSAENSMNS